MDMAGLVLGTDGLLGILELSRVPTLSCGPFNIRHDDKNDDVVLYDDAVSLCFACLNLELLDGVN